MKFPNAFTSLLGKKEQEKEYLFSLYVDVDAAAVAAWYVDPVGNPHVVSFAHGVVAEDTWEARVAVIDRLLSAAEDEAKVERAIKKTVFGLPGVYLTREGNIAEGIRPQLKKLTSVLDLTPVGFVPLSQAMAFSFKKEEGVPPSAIFIGCSSLKATVTIFRVGKAIGEEIIDVADPALAIEAVLKKYQDGDVLPSRMLLYGGNTERIEEARAKLLKHPWPTRANFLHFPKIETLPLEDLLTAVSLSGASELAADIGEEPQTAQGEVATVVAQPRPAPGASKEPQVQEVAPEEIEEEEVEGEEKAEKESEEAAEGETLEEATEEDHLSEDLANVELVSPESLGFRKEDVLERVAERKSKVEEPQQTGKKPLPFTVKLPVLPRFSFDSLRSMVGRLPKPSGVHIPIIGIVAIGLLLTGLYFIFIPRAAVTVLVLPETLDASTTLTVDPVATIADPATKIIPGKSQEKSVSGEKAVTVTGKKKVGDPAKGTVTVYNKVTSARTLSKGAVLTAKGLSFTLDNDVTIASASETIGSITFGKGNVGATASDIGPEGNVPANTDFTFKDIASSSLSARNDNAFAGGTSRDVTVVSRADEDNLVKALTDDLVGQAKAQLLQQVSGERLIDQTVKTQVADKTFTEELDQEAKDLHGKVTISVTGISVHDDDVKAILMPLITAKLSSGYSAASGQSDIAISGIKVQKDGKIAMTAKLTITALPTIDAATLTKKLAGKNVNAAMDILKSTPGVAGAEFRFVLSPTKSRLPFRGSNISITTAVSQ